MYHEYKSDCETQGTSTVDSPYEPLRPTKSLESYENITLYHIIVSSALYTDIDNFM